MGEACEGCGVWVIQPAFCRGCVGDRERDKELGLTGGWGGWTGGEDTRESERGDSGGERR